MGWESGFLRELARTQTFTVTKTHKVAVTAFPLYPKNILAKEGKKVPM